MRVQTSRRQFLGHLAPTSPLSGRERMHGPLLRLSRANSELNRNKSPPRAKGSQPSLKRMNNNPICAAVELFITSGIGGQSRGQRDQDRQISSLQIPPARGRRRLARFCSV